MAKRGRGRRKRRGNVDAPTSFDDLPRVQREGTIAPDDLDGLSAPRPVDDVVQVEVDGEQLVIGGSWGGAQILNPTGALVWQFLDGDVTLDELVDDFTEATGTPRAIVLEDVLTFARSLGAAGLLVDVEVPHRELEQDVAPPISFEDGQTFEPFAATDLEGTDRALTDFHGRKVFLVNWNPGCGYCGAIAETLAGLEQELAESGVDLVLVASGEADANRTLAERSGLRAPMLLKPDGVDPFGGLGTPAALLLDADGLVSGELARGA